MVLNDRVTTQNGDALAMPVEPQVRPVRAKMEGVPQAAINNAGRVRRPIAIALVPVFGHFLKTHYAHLEIVNGCGNPGQFAVLIVLLIAMQVEDQDR